MSTKELLLARARYHYAAHSPAFSHPDGRAGRARLLTLAQGMGMEALRRPGFWNDGTIDAVVPNIVKCDAWPPARTLRIVDYDSDSIHFYSREKSCWSYAGSNDARPLPEPSRGEILLIRQEGHFMLVDPDSDQLIHDVPRDGDCFFSCISTALGSAESTRAVSNLRLRDSVARYIESDPALLAIASLPDITPQIG